ncbi:MAG: hypothetical protein RL454_1007, partial [Actinomycetota bacterium]
MSKFLKALISATLAAVSLTTIQQTVAQATPGPFGCTPDFYQASNGDMYHLDISSYQYTTMAGNSNVNGLNAIGYNTADNFIYGIDGNSDLVKVFDDGSHSAPIATTGVTPKGTGGTFIAPNRMLTSNTSGSFTTLDLGTNPPTVADFTDTGTAWAAADIAFYPALKTAYGLDGNTLYVATFDSGLTTLDVSTKTFTNNFNSRDAWGAAYVDRDGNGYFFDNATSDLYEVPAAILQSASATITATLLNASTTLTSPNDGASCPDALAPMAATPSPTPTPSAQPPAPTYPVYFDGNGGGPNPPTQSYNSNICFALPDGPSRPGYTFV